MREPTAGLSVAIKSSGLFLVVILFLAGSITWSWMVWTSHRMEIILVVADDASLNAAEVADEAMALPGVLEARVVPKDHGLQQLARVTERTWLSLLIENPLPNLVALRVSWKSCWTGSLPELMERLGAIQGVSRTIGHPDAMMRMIRFGGFLCLSLTLAWVGAAWLLGLFLAWLSHIRAEALTPLIHTIKFSGGTFSQAVALSHRHQIAEAFLATGVAFLLVLGVYFVASPLTVPWMALGWVHWGLGVCLTAVASAGVSSMVWRRAIKIVWDSCLVF